MQNSNQNTVQFNTVGDNGWSGLCFDQSVNNNINGNNIENNPEQAPMIMEQTVMMMVVLVTTGTTGVAVIQGPIDGGSNVDNHPSATPF